MENWKTTSAGITSIVSGISTIVYSIYTKDLNPSVITTGVTFILTGIGLILAKDSTTL